MSYILKAASISSSCYVQSKFILPFKYDYSQVRWVNRQIFSKSLLMRPWLLAILLNVLALITLCVIGFSIGMGIDSLSKKTLRN